MSRLAGADGLAALGEQPVVERERIHVGGEPATIPVVAQEGEMAALTSRDSFDWFHLAGAEAPSWRNQVTLRSLERLLEYAPGRFIDRIAPTPLLLMPARDDFLPLDITEAAFARAGEPKKLLVLPGGHFSGYEPPLFTSACAEATAWFSAHLGQRRG